MSTTSDVDELALDGLIGDAVEILTERALTAIATPSNVRAWRIRTRKHLHYEHDRQAHELLAADLEHSGTVTITAKMLANLLDPPASPPSVPPPRSAPNVYELAEQRRQERPVPEEWLDPDTQNRCLAEARAIRETARAAQAAAEAAAAAAKVNPSDGATR